MFIFVVIDCMYIIMCYFVTASEYWYLKSEPSHRYLSLGSDSAVNCINFTVANSSDNAYNIKIMDNGGLRNVSGERVQSDTHQLRFRGVLAEDNGFYCCKTLSDSNCSAKTTVEINIEYPPVFLPLHNITAFTGDKIMLNCSIKNNVGCGVKFLWHGRNIHRKSQTIL